MRGHSEELGPGFFAGADSWSENLRAFVDDVSHLNVPSLAVFVQRAKGLYDENMKAYIKMMLRRGFSRLMVCSDCDWICHRERS